uniref:SFRICE_004644 n=1 Tax=Spodoptera frugiperda TaxID=7108 RepID=A0A2H1VGA8_SPOFR
MPERPKRRKNNKNKRKNKNNKPEVIKNNSDEKKLDSGESCNSKTDSKEDLVENESVVSEEIKEEILQPSIENENASGSTSSDVVNLNGDLNNNSDEIVENVPPSPTDKCVVVDVVDASAYVVEAPGQSRHGKSKVKLSSKSKSLDDDEATKIIDVTEDVTAEPSNENALALIDTQNVIVTHVDSDVEWENAAELNEVDVKQPKELVTGTLSVTSIPLTVAQCEQTKSLTPDEEKSLRNYLNTLNLATQPDGVNSVEIKTEIEEIINQEIKHRLRKKAMADDFFLHRLGPPRMLDVIDEEGSSGSSMTSRRQSYLSDKRSDVEDLEDDVFEDNKNKLTKQKKMMSTAVHKKSFGKLVPQECLLVGAKIKEPEVSEARGDWTMKTVEKMTGAEVVYLTDTSSSTSSLHEIGEDDDDGVDTDASVRMITPTIEVTDTENFLKKTFISNTDNNKQDTNTGKTIEIPIQIIPNEKVNDEIEKKNTNAERIIKVQVENDTSTSEQSKNIVENISSQNSHEIVVLSTDNIKTNLYVKDIEEPINKDDNKMQAKQNKYELESKLIKCEFNDAINNLIKEVVSESEETNENAKETFSRQDSSSSVDSSQCTAKYNPNYSSLNDIVSMTHDETTTNNKTNTEQLSSTASHVKDVFECVTGAPRQNKTIADDDTKEPLKLRDLCVRNIATLPYGKKILEELASVSERLQNIALYGAPANVIDKKTDTDKMPHYRLPDVSSIDTITIPVKTKDPIPPPVKPRRSSLRKTSQEEEHWTGVPTKTEPVYVCLSPSQKMLMEKTNTVITKDEASHLVDMHRKFVDRRGYNEQYKSDKEREESDVDNTPVIPFKSQTGSRLLALIRDPTLTNNINSLNQRLNSSTDDIQRKRTTTTSTTFMKSNHDRFANRDFSFKPIPPPRPKKYSSSFYESDESSDFTDSSMRSMKSERKFFHYSTGNLSKEIESDVSSIQNMHRFFTDKRDEINDYKSPRRPSLPKDLCEQQMEYIRKKEKEVEAEIQRLEALKSNIPQMQKSPGPRAPLISEKEVIDERIKDSNNYSISRKKDVVMTSHGSEPKKGKLSSVFSSSQEELLREKMYSEYVSQMAEREERRQHKVIKITNTPSSTNHITVSKSMPALDILDAKVNNRIEKEFISKARERWDKLGIKDPETEDERESNNVYKEPKVIEHKIKVIEGGEEKDVKKLPSHLQEFVRFTAKDSEKSTSSAGESPGPASPHLVIMCAVIIIVIAVCKYFLRLLRNK